MRFVLLILLLVGCNQVDSTDSESKLIGGELDSSGKWSSVIYFDYYLDGTWVCSGTKVSEDLILTAAHCVMSQKAAEDKEENGKWKIMDLMSPGKMLNFSFDAEVTEDTELNSAEIVEILLPPQVNKCFDSRYSKENKHLCQWRVPIPDVAFIRINSIGELVGSEYANIKPSVIDNRRSVRSGEEFIIVGYGYEGVGDYDVARKKSGSQTVVNSDDYNTVIKDTTITEDGDIDWKYFFGSLVTAEKGVSLGGGDSGGPVFNSSGKKIIGVNSDGLCPKSDRWCDVADNSIFSRLTTIGDSELAQWIADSL